MITPDELQEVIQRITARDQRTFGRADLADWAESAQDGRWTHAAAMRAVREHLRDPDAPRISPAHVDAKIRKMRSRAAETFREPDVPEGMPAQEYLAVLRAAKQEHVDRVVAQWAADGVLPAAASALVPGRRVSSIGELVATAPPAVRAEVTVAVERFGRMQATDGPRALRRPKGAADVHRREEARAEIEALRKGAA